MYSLTEVTQPAFEVTPLSGSVTVGVCRVTSLRCDEALKALFLQVFKTQTNILIQNPSPIQQPLYLWPWLQNVYAIYMRNTMLASLSWHEALPLSTVVIQPSEVLNHRCQALTLIPPPTHTPLSFLTLSRCLADWRQNGITLLFQWTLR